MDRALTPAARRRISEERFDPDRAPHRGLVRELVASTLPPLQLRLRARAIDALVLRLLELERDPVPLVEEPRPVQLATLVQRAEQALQQLELEERALVRQFRNFGTLHAQTEDPERRARLIADYLAETVHDPARLRGDLAAMRRHLGYDTLRERSNRAVLACSIQGELALWFIAGAAREVAAARAEAPDAARVIAEPDRAVACAARVVAGRRWQVRWAAGQATLALADAIAADAPPAERVAPLVEALRPATEQRDEHPWVQAAALEATLALDPALGRAALRRRLFEPSGELDLFLRKLALDLAARRLPADERAALIVELVAAGDPSEHVRMALVDAAATLPWDVAAPLLARLGGADEPSPKVRASVAIAARRRAAAGDDAAATLVEAVAADPHPFPGQVACEELAALAADLAAAGRRDVLEARAPGWLASLAARIVDPATAPRVAELAAAAAEAIQRERDPAWRALAAKLRGALDQIPRGGRGRVELPAELAEPARVGRALAALTRDDWGVSARLRGRRLTLWRGDRFRRRLWRVLHELRNPLPNKRQAWIHTTGRTYPGELRAHPTLLDEATATTVPGERVTVDSEGSWARHLPGVDDVLDLPVWSGRPVEVVSSLGTTIVEGPPTRLRRLANRVRIAWRYRELAGARLASLRTYRDRRRRRYVEELARRYGVAMRFEPHRRDAAGAVAAPVPPVVTELFVGAEDEPAASSPSAAPGVTALALAGPLTELGDWLASHRAYFTSPTQNSQLALVAFGGALATLFFTGGWRKRREIEHARAAIPLTLGGWGTRGKSGTERLKAGMLDGLGFEVFVKTTGCEAMFIHSAPMAQPVEIFIYRPYDKATIWEQRALLLLAARLRAEVFLWECMALNPRYVQQLQRDWMKDDLVTLTNCYPDHEDIQGPAGFNVADVITEFIPDRSTLVTSETSYLPMFRDVCRARGTTLYTVGERDAELIADDVLDLFPYREHPRNIALVTRVGVELGLEPDLARLTMAQNVVPDLGVLKAYPRCRVRGRYLTFVCGNSANERTGFMNNWRRMKLDQLDLDREPHRLVVTVVNNRADRIARSEVFARILVRDVAFDRHVLIGTNLKGLRGFLDAALGDYLRETSLVEPDELRPGAVPDVVATRVARELGNLRIPRPAAEAALVRLAIYAAPAGAVVDATRRDALAAEVTRWLRDGLDGAVELADVRKQVRGDRALVDAARAALVARTTPEPDDDWPETLESPTVDDAIEAFTAELARMVVRARLEDRLTRLFAAPSEAARGAFRAEFAAAYRAMFLAQVEVIEDAGATGDQIIERCARSVPPGSEVTLMGTQNIKGTGLDFVYRWLALDLVVRTLREQASGREDRRLAALIELEGFEDHGLVDTGLARAILARLPPHRPGPDEAAARQRIAAKVEAIWQRRRAALVEQKKAGLLDRVAAWTEGWLDWMDSVRRTHAARRIVDDLVEQRISHGRASIEMRKLVGRVKGGWLVKALRGR